MLRTEMPIFDEDLDMAGTVDFLGQDSTGAFHICEWKRVPDYESKAEVWSSCSIPPPLPGPMNPPGRL